MKIIDVPQTGKLGLTVTYPSRSGLIRRSWVVPANPRSADQLVQRGYLASIASAYDSLSEDEQDAWIAAAAQEQSKATLGQSGPLTGLQLFVKLNSNLRRLGSEEVLTPPAKEPIPALPVTGLAVTNTAGVIALKLACSTDLPENTVLSGAPPQNSGTRRPITTRWLGECPAVSGGFSTVTTLYTNKFGVPAVGSRLFVSVRTYAAGWPGPELALTALVPAAV